MITIGDLVAIDFGQFSAHDYNPNGTLGLQETIDQTMQGVVTGIDLFNQTATVMLGENQEIQDFVFK